MKVTRIACDDPMDRSEFIPLMKVDYIALNADGHDWVLSNGNRYVCYNGEFRVSEWKGEEE